MTSKTSSASHQTMMSSTTEPSASSSRWVYWARPGATLRRSLVSSRCRRVEGVGALDPDRAQVAHVEGHRRRSRQARCSAIVPVRVGERHQPAAEPHQLGPEGAVTLFQGRVPQ